MIKIPNTPSIYEVSFNYASMICVFITVTVHGYAHLVDSDRVLSEQEGHSADTV